MVRDPTAHAAASELIRAIAFIGQLRVLESGDDLVATITRRLTNRAGRLLTGEARMELADTEICDAVVSRYREGG